MIGRIAALAAILLLATVIEAAVWRMPTAADLAFEVNGGDHFAYLRADPADLASGARDLRMWVEAPRGALFDALIHVSPESANRDYSHALYWSLRDKDVRLSTIYAGGMWTGRSLPPGRYVVEISARNGTLIEALILESVCAGCRIEQSITLTRVGGDVVYRSPR